MEKPLIQITRYSLQIAIALGVLYGLVHLTMQIIRPESQSTIAQKRGQAREYVLKEVETVLSRFQIDMPTKKEQDIPLSERDLISLEIVKTLEAENIEIYRLVDNENISLHIYDQNEKIFILNFIEAKSKQEAPKTIVQTQTDLSHPIAIVLAGIGRRDIRTLTAISHPINFAIHPHQPFSLRVAKEAAHNWHEIIVDQRDLEEEDWNSLPFYSGALVTNTSTPPSEHIDILSVKSPRLVQLPTQDVLRLDRIKEAWEQAIQTAKQRQSAIFLLELHHADTSAVQMWLDSLPDDIPLALLSEISQATPE